MIDAHVHFRDWDQSYKETVKHGLEVAKKAGFTHVFDMPNTSPVVVDRESVLDRLALGNDASRSVKGISYHTYIALTSSASQIQEAVETFFELYPMVIGLKLFAGNSTGNIGIVSLDDQKKIFRELAKNGYPGVVAVHCEKESLLKPSLFVPGHFESHSLARPAQAELESVKDIVGAACEASFKGTLHIAHVSCRATIEYIKKVRALLPFRITMGATAHHALFCTEDAADSLLYLKMNPPLRDASDRDYVFSSLLDGTIDWIESDHAPHTLEDKKKGASGIPGLCGSLVLIAKLKEAGASEERLRKLCTLNCAQTFGLEVLPSEILCVKDPMKRAATVADEYEFNPFKRFLQ